MTSYRPGPTSARHCASTAAIIRVAASAALSPRGVRSGPPGEEAEELFRQRLQLTRVLVDMAAEIPVTAPA